MASGELSDKTAVITGGGRGLGRAMALGLAHAGANVVVTAARTRHEIDAMEDEAAKARRAGTVRALMADVTGEEDCWRVVNEALRQFGAVHILVNNAGRGLHFVSESFFDSPTQLSETDPRCGG